MFLYKKASVLYQLSIDLMAFGLRVSAILEHLQAIDHAC